MKILCMFDCSEVLEKGVGTVLKTLTSVFGSQHFETYTFLCMYHFPVHNKLEL